MRPSLYFSILVFLIPIALLFAEIIPESTFPESYFVESEFFENEFHQNESYENGLHESVPMENVSPLSSEDEPAVDESLDNELLLSAWEFPENESSQSEAIAPPENAPPENESPKSISPEYFYPEHYEPVRSDSEHIEPEYYPYPHVIYPLYSYPEYSHFQHSYPEYDYQAYSLPECEYLEMEESESSYLKGNFFEFSNTPYFLSLRRNQGECLGSDLSYTTLESLSFPFHIRNIWPFLDLRVHCFDDAGKYAANIGIGFRVAPKCTNQIFGVNFYYDCRNAHHAHFNQFGIGFEMLGDCWNFRLNGYLPVGKKSYLKSCCFYDQYIGDYYFLRQNFIDGLKGINFEVEPLLAKMCWGDIYLAVGGYYYHGDACRKNIYGSAYRLSTDFCNYFSFEILATYDCVFKTRVQAQLTFTIPLNCHCLQDARLFQRVERQDIIVIQKRKRFEWNF